ncbi:MAG: flavodoxin family protein [Candidatus Dehalobacter alkaniphilus]|uniref:flavodoxin family protein n=1 Tax=Dehalobacter sp. DCM TaxID=2907827 RepID=UPI0030818484|nr:flavodoxin family protein [Dehalobacter sp. DCM]
MKITVLYVSVTGNTEKMAGYIEEGIEETGCVEVRLMNLAQEETMDYGFIEDSKAVIIGTPAYVADMCWQLKKWFDTDWNCSLAGKLGAAFATANCMHGGADLAISSVLSHMLVKGMLVYSSGMGCGRPFIHLGPVALRDDLEGKKELFQLFGRRVAEKAVELFR